MFQRGTDSTHAVLTHLPADTRLLSPNWTPVLNHCPVPAHISPIHHLISYHRSSTTHAPSPPVSPSVLLSYISAVLEPRQVLSVTVLCARTNTGCPAAHHRTQRMRRWSHLMRSVKQHREAVNSQWVSTRQSQGNDSFLFLRFYLYMCTTTVHFTTSVSFFFHKHNQLKPSLSYLRCLSVCSMRALVVLFVCVKAILRFSFTIFWAVCEQQKGAAMRVSRWWGLEGDDSKQQRVSVKHVRPSVGGVCVCDPIKRNSLTHPTMQVAVLCSKKRVRKACVIWPDHESQRGFAGMWGDGPPFLR